MIFSEQHYYAISALFIGSDIVQKFRYSQHTFIDI